MVNGFIPPSFLHAAGKIADGRLAVHDFLCEFHIKGAALAVHTLHMDLTIHEPKEAHRNGQAQSRSLNVLVAGGIQPFKIPEQSPFILLLYAYARIRHTNLQQDFVLTAPLAGNGKDNTAFWGVFHCIGQKIDEDLPYTNCIAIQLIGEGFLYIHVEGEPLVPGFRLHQIHGIHQQRIQLVCGFHQFHATRFNFGKIQNVIDKRQQSRARTGNILGIVQGKGFLAFPENHFIHPQNSVDRGSDLVTHTGEEVALCAVGSIRDFLGIANGLCFRYLRLYHEEVNACQRKKHEEKGNHRKHQCVNARNTACHRIPRHKADHRAVGLGEVCAKEKKSAPRPLGIYSGASTGAKFFPNPFKIHLYGPVLKKRLILFTEALVGYNHRAVPLADEDAAVRIVFFQAKIIVKHIFAVKPIKHITHVVPIQNRHGEEESLTGCVIHNGAAGKGTHQLPKIPQGKGLSLKSAVILAEYAAGNTLPPHILKKPKALADLSLIAFHVMGSIAKLRQFPLEAFFRQHREIRRLSGYRLFHRGGEQFFHLVLHEKTDECKNSGQYQDFCHHLAAVLHGIRISFHVIAQ